MGSRSGLFMQIFFCATLFVASSPAVCARFSTMVPGSAELQHILEAAGRAGSRGLLQSSTVNSCPYDFSKVDFSSVTSACKGPNYDVKLCCAPFTSLACQYKPQINDFDSLCPIYFISYLNVAGGYPAGVFVGEGRCNSGDALCSS